MCTWTSEHQLERKQSRTELDLVVSEPDASDWSIESGLMERSDEGLRRFDS